MISGKKNKKVDANKCLLLTMTGEPFQPVRLYYKIYNPAGIQKSLQLLKCMNYNPSKDRVEWLYEEEALELKFQNAYSSIPKDRHPLIIGTFQLKGTGVILDLKSFDRAIQAIAFFDKHIKRTYAKVTDIAIVNRFFDSEEDIPSSFDMFFDSDELFEKNPDDLYNKIMETHSNLGAKAAIDLVHMESQFTHLVEKWKLSFYEEGIVQLETMLKFRHMLAYEHWIGNTEMTMKDLIDRIIK